MSLHSGILLRKSAWGNRTAASGERAEFRAGRLALQRRVVQSAKPSIVPQIVPKCCARLDNRQMLALADARARYAGLKS
jgi:hypothetical protein